MSIPASTNAHLPVRTGMPNNVASIESVVKFVMVGLLTSVTVTCEMESRTIGVNKFGLRADDHDSSLRTDFGGKVMASSIRHLRSWFPGRPGVLKIPLFPRFRFPLLLLRIAKNAEKTATWSTA